MSPTNAVTLDRTQLMTFYTQTKAVFLTLARFHKITLDDQGEDHYTNLTDFLGYFKDASKLALLFVMC